MDVAAGSWHTCAVTMERRLVFFGLNALGQCTVPPGLGPVAVVPAGVVLHELSDTGSVATRTVIQPVPHTEAPAEIDEQEATQPTSAQHANPMERNTPDTAAGDATDPDDEEEATAPKRRRTA